VPRQPFRKIYCTLQIHEDVLNGPIAREIAATEKRIVNERNNLFRSRLSQEVVFHSTEEEFMGRWPNAARSIPVAIVHTVQSKAHNLFEFLGRHMANGQVENMD
jgi:hypothetical protein